MLRLKLKGFLRRRGITETALADVVADVFIDSGKGVSDRYLRYLTYSSKANASKAGQRTPSLEMLDRLIIALRHMTGEEITFDDLIECVSESEISSSNAKSTPPPDEELTESRELVEYIYQEPDKALEELKELTVQSLKNKGHEKLGQELASFYAYSSDEGHEIPQENKRRRFTARGLLMMLSGLLVLATSFIMFDQLVLKPRLIAGYTRLFTSRDRVRPTSSLPVPTLIGPEGDIAELAPTLRVTPVEKAIAYEFYVENTVSNDYVYTGPVPTTTFLIPAGTLCPNTTYMWRARALGNDGWTSISSPLSFTVTSEALERSQQHLLNLANIKSSPQTPEIVAPIGTTNTTTPTLEVNQTPNTYGYGFYIRDLGSDKLVYENHFVSENAVTIPEGVLENGGVYQWNARLRNCHYWSEFTPTQIFTVNVNE
jgi:hypothetical protein